MSKKTFIFVIFLITSLLIFISTVIIVLNNIEERESKSNENENNSNIEIIEEGQSNDLNVVADEPEYKTYRFESYPVSLEYPKDMNIEEKYSSNSKITTVFSKGNISMNVRPEQPGIGFTDDQTVTTENFLPYGEEFYVEGKKISKTKVVNNYDDSEISYIIIIPYPEQLNMKASIMFSYAVETNTPKKVIEEFDNVIASIKFIE